MMSDSDPTTSTASLLTTNTTSSSFDPSNKTKRPRSQKDYAAALSTLQSKYGLPEASALTVPLPLSSSKSPTSSKPSSGPARPLATTASSSTAVEKAKKGNSSLSLLWAKYRLRRRS